MGIAQHCSEARRCIVEERQSTTKGVGFVPGKMTGRTKLKIQNALRMEHDKDKENWRAERGGMNGHTEEIDTKRDRYCEKWTSSSVSNAEKNLNEYFTNLLNVI